MSKAPTMKIISKASKDGKVSALGIGICGHHASMIGVYKVGASGRVNEMVYRHNLKTGGVIQSDDLDRYGINIKDAVSAFIEDMGAKTKGE